MKLFLWLLMFIECMLCIRGNICTLHAQSLQLCLTLWDPKACNPQASSVHGILQARMLACVAISFSRGSSWPRNWTWVSCIAGRFFTSESLGKDYMHFTQIIYFDPLGFLAIRASYVMVMVFSWNVPAQQTRLEDCPLRKRLFLCLKL